MTRVAWWTCALLALELAVSHGRIYHRCELARDLRALGVHPDHISTWVCIAYHESRFDTAANNPHSGDHGLFQISELYWCGAGKACGLPCAALRDDDIADDLECALQVHEEHTRLQGDGFLAWVVYPQHCRGSTKKYLIDCDEQPKNASVESQGRSFNSFTTYENRYRTKEVDKTYSNNPNIDNLLPPYLAISSIFRGSYGKVLDHNKINGLDWFNYKYDKVDELKLPDFVPGIGKTPVRPTTTPTTTTTTTTYVPPVKPWRFIETNQFRKKVISTDKTTLSPTTKQDYNPLKVYTQSSSALNLPTESTTHKSLTSVTVADISPKVKTTITSYKSPSTLTSTIKPVNVKTTAYKWPAFTTSYKSWTTTNRPSTTTLRAPTGSPNNYVTSATVSRVPSSTTTIRPKFSPSVFAFPTTTKPTTVSATALTFPTRSFAYRIPSFTTTTVKPSTATYKAITRKPQTTTTLKTTPVPTTSRPTTPWYSFTSKSGSTAKPSFSQYTWSGFTTKPRYLHTTKSLSTSTTQRPTSPTVATPRPTYSTSTTQRSTFSTSTQRSVSSSTTARPTRTTQNIFDLYLNPTKAPMLPSYSFFQKENRKFKLNIFSGGTTSISPLAKNGPEVGNHVDKNQVRREISA